MQIEQTVAPTTEPVTLAVAKNYLRQTTDQDNALITSIITSARILVEKELGRSLVTQTWKLYLDKFPDYSTCPIQLPKGPIQSISSITYEDSNGDTQTWSASNYQLDNKQFPARVLPAYSLAYPSARTNANSITITFVSGYGDASDVPEQYVQAMLLLIKHQYDMRTIATSMDKETARSIGYILGFDRIATY